MKVLTERSRSVKKVLIKVAISSLLMLAFPAVVCTATVAPTIDSISNTATYPGALISIAGSSFGDIDPASYVEFNSGACVASSDTIIWTDTRIVCIVPEKAEKGEFFVVAKSAKSNKISIDINSLLYKAPCGEIIRTGLGKGITAYYEDGSDKVEEPANRSDYFNWVIWNRLWIHNIAANTIEEYYIPRAYSDLDKDKVFVAKDNQVRIKRDYNSGRTSDYFSKDGLLLDVDGSSKVVSLKYTTSIPNKGKNDADYMTYYYDWEIETDCLAHTVGTESSMLVKSIYSSKYSPSQFSVDFHYMNTSFAIDDAEYVNKKGDVVLSVKINPDKTYTATHLPTGAAFERIKFNGAGDCFLMMNSILRYIDGLSDCKENLVSYYKFKEGIDVTNEIVMPNVIGREISSPDSHEYTLVRRPAAGGADENNIFNHFSMRLFISLISASGNTDFALPDGTLVSFNSDGQLISEQFSDLSSNEYFYNKNGEYVAYSHTDQKGDTIYYQQSGDTFIDGGKILADTVDGEIVFYVGYPDKGFNAIDEAYNLAGHGSIIQLNAGEYNQGSLKIEKDITLRGDPAYERGQIVIDAKNQKKQFAYIKKVDVRVNNLTFKNFANSVFLVKAFNSNKTALSLSGIDFLSNKSKAGGCVYIEKSKLDVDNCTFTGNVAGSARGSLQYSSGGGAIASRGGIVNITNSDFINNTGKGGGYVGGAIDAKGGALDISYSLFSGNTAKTGAAIEIGGQSARTSANITQCTFANNATTIGAGGVINISRCRRWSKTKARRYWLEYLNAGSTLNFSKNIIYQNKHNDITVEQYSSVIIGDSVLSKEPIGQGNISDNSIQDNPLYNDAASSDYRISKSTPAQAAGIAWGSEGFYDEPAAPVDHLVWNITKDLYYDLIQDAIDAADANDEIHVRGADGGFDGIFNEQITVNKALVLRGGYDSTFDETARDHDATPTVIDAQQSGRVVTSNITGEGTNVIIDGFTLQNGSEIDGAGMFLTVTDMAHILVEECKVKENVVEGHGIGGAGIFVNADNSYLLFCSNEILDNSLNGYYGAGIYATLNNSAEVEISDTVVSGNKIYGTEIDKQWNACGAGIAVQGDSTTRALIVNSLIVENSFEYCSDGRGIGICAEAPTEIINSTIANNELINTDSKEVRGGLYTSSEIKLVNSIVYFTYGMQNWGRPNNISYSDIEGYEAGFQGIISLDPKFVDMDNGDYRLLEDSPCIDAGDGDSARDTDIDNKERNDVDDVDDTGIGDPAYVDMGAYEFEGEIATPAPNPPANFRAEQIHSTPEGMNYGAIFNWDDETNGEMRFYIESTYLGHPNGILVDPNKETVQSHYCWSFEEVPWTYRIKAEMTDGTFTEWTDLVTVNFMYGPYPLTATSTTPRTITLEWLDRSATEQGYIIERSPDGDESTFVEISRMGGVPGNNTTVTFNDADLDPGTYYYRVYAHNETGVSNYSNAASYTLEVEAPDPPEDLMARQIDTSVDRFKYGIKLTWSDVTDGETAYDVLYTYNGGSRSFNASGNTEQTGVMFEGEPGHDGQEMVLKIRAEMPDGTHSDWSNESTVILMQEPDTLTTTSTLSGAITLSWHDRTGYEQGYVIQRSPDGNSSTFVEIARIGPSAGKNGVLTYEDAGLDINTYRYRVYAYNDTGVSNYSNVDSYALERSNAPSGLGALQVPAVSDSLQHVELRWKDNTDGEIGYQVAYKNVSVGSDFTVYDVIETPGLEFYHQILYTSSEYELLYKVRAKLPSGEYTDWSNEVTVYLIARPEHITAQSKKRGCIELKWQDRSRHEDGYRIERSADGVNYEIIAETQTIAGSYVYTTYEDKNLTSGKYWYRISGFNSTGQSNYKIREYLLANGMPATGQRVYNVQKQKYYNSIQSAIDDADSSNTLRCMGKTVGFDGLFRENIYFRFKSIKLEGGYDDTFTSRDIEAMPSVIDGQGKGRVLECMLPGHSLEIDGFTIQNGFIDGDSIAADAVHGSGLYIKLSGHGSFVLKNSKVINNTAYNNWILYGGGISIGGSSTTSATIINSLIADNIQKKCEHAIGTGLFSLSKISIINSTIANNRTEEVSDKDHGDFCIQTARASVLNSIIRSEQGIYLKRGGTLVGQYSNIEGYSEAGRNGNIDVDPEFVEPAAGNYQLKATSPCIGTAREGKGNMGCYE